MAGATRISARAYNFLKTDNWVLSGQVTGRVPGTFDYRNPAAIGYTSFETDVRGLVGYSFPLAGLPAFIDFEVAQRFSFSGPPNEVHIDGTFGIRAGSAVAFAGSVLHRDLRRQSPAHFFKL